MLGDITMSTRGSRSGHAPGASSSAAAGDSALIADAMQVLSRSATGAAIVEGLNEQDVPIVVLPDNEFFTRYPDGMIGLYDPRFGKIVVPRSALSDPAQGAIMLAHEGTHAINSHDQAGGHVVGIFLDAFRSIGDAFNAALHLDNPATAAVDGGRGRAVDDEVHAYITQARVEDELGIKAERIADFGHNPDGSLASEKQARSRIAEVDIYREIGPMRTARVSIHAMLVSCIGLLAAEAGAAMLGRGLPTGPAAAIAGLSTLGMVAHDWVTHRDDRAA